MEVDSAREALSSIASGGAVEEGSWPGLRTDILTRLDEIAHDAFPIPILPPPASPPRLLSPLPSSPVEQWSQEANKENTPVQRPSPTALEPGQLPQQIADLLAGIKAQLASFTAQAPHTVQRLAELVLAPRAHYRALASYLHAVDRVIQVTSGIDVYPLPPAVPDMSAMRVNGEDPASAVAWSNPTTSPLGSDEALGGALLTPIPWLTRRSPEGNDEAAGAQIHSEGSETIDGPNGMGRIETVSVSVNGVPSTGHARGVTQGELLRQEQRAGVVPLSQLSRNQEAPSDEARGMDDQDDETPHARGPEEIGVGDTGPQGVTTSYVGEDGVGMHGIDVEAAVGRKHDEPPPRDTEAAGTKREAEQDLERDTSKKARESIEAGGASPTREAVDEPPPSKQDEANALDAGTMEES